MEKLLSKMGGGKKQIENIVIFIILLIIVIIVINSLFNSQDEAVKTVNISEVSNNTYANDEMEIKLKNILSKINRCW